MATNKVIVVWLQRKESMLLFRLTERRVSAKQDLKYLFSLPKGMSD